MSYFNLICKINKKEMKYIYFLYLFKIKNTLYYNICY